MKKLFTIFLFAAISASLSGQTTQKIVINKPLQEFPDVYDLSTPLNAGITILYIGVNGIDSRWRDVSSFANSSRHRKENLPNRTVSEESKMKLLNQLIEEIIVYKDSIACMITKRDSSDYSIRWLYYENSEWLNRGEDGRSTLEEAQELFNTYASESLDELRRSNIVKNVSTDTLAFVNYVKQSGVEPKEFLFNVLAKHPLVIYGEIHRRNASWNLLSTLLTDPRFPETVGTVFVEMPAYQQNEFDRFYASKELNTEILLNIMRTVQTVGWLDRGQYDFLINVWKLNQTLPENKKIRVVPTDEQPPWKFLQTREDYDKWEEKSLDRNTKMADVIEHTLKTKTDKRNCLFITGYGHAYKSHIPGSYSSAPEQEPALSAGAQLVQRLSEKNVFVVLQHVPMGTNFGYLGLVRQGLFDAAFEKAGNKPVAFPLTNSPFGAEPFDADFYDSFDHGVGNYADNFDGYIFLKPLKDEDEDCMLYEIYSDEFINEFKRRVAIFNQDPSRRMGVEGELTKEKLINPFKEKCESEKVKRWSYLFE